MVASTFRACTSWSMMRDTRVSILNAGGSRSSFTQSRAARSSCSISFIHSSVVWCCTMKSYLVVVGRAGAGR